MQSGPDSLIWRSSAHRVHSARHSTPLHTDKAAKCRLSSPMASWSTQVSLSVRYSSPLRISGPGSFRISKGWHFALSHIDESSELPKESRPSSLPREEMPFTGCGVVPKRRDTLGPTFLSWCLYCHFAPCRLAANPVHRVWIKGSLFDSWNLQLLQVRSKKWAAKPQQPPTYPEPHLISLAHDRLKCTSETLVYSPTAGCSSNLPLSAVVLIQNCGRACGQVHTY